MNRSNNLSMSDRTDRMDWPVDSVPYERPRNLKRASVRELENEIQKLRREVIDLRIRLETRDNERFNKIKNFDSMVQQLEESKITIKILHHILDNNIGLLREAEIAINEHETYQQSQQMKIQLKIKELEKYILDLEVRNVFSSSYLYSYPVCLFFTFFRKLSSRICIILRAISALQKIRAIK